MNEFNPFDAFSVFKSKKYWKTLGVIAACFAAMIVMIIPFAFLIGDKEMYEFAAFDWVCFAVFVLIELALLVVVAIFVVKSFRIGAKSANNITHSYIAQFQFEGLENREFDEVWLSYKGTKRVVIVGQSGVFKFTLEKFHSVKTPWVLVADGQFSTLDELNRALYYEHKFYCEANTEIDDYGKKTFKG